MPTEIADSRPSSRRTISARLAHGHALAAINRYRPAWTGHLDEPLEVMRSVKAFVDRLNSRDVDCIAPMNVLCPATVARNMTVLQPFDRNGASRIRLDNSGSRRSGRPEDRYGRSVDRG
jgi:hypothetical protein